MDIHTHISIPTSYTSHRFSSPTQSLSSSSFSSYFPFKFVVCSKRDDQSQRNGDNKGDKSSTDWDKAWSNFKKQGKKTLFSNFSPNKYVSWNPRRSDFPISEEVDPIKRTERSNLKFWTSPTFTLVVHHDFVKFRSSTFPKIMETHRDFVNLTVNPNTQLVVLAY